MDKRRLPIALLVSLAAIPLLAGCIAYVHGSFPMVVGEGYGHHGYYGNPVPQYYCYDCHGYRYFDPYYDYCSYYGFRFDWYTHPSVHRYYREHHTIIVRDTPHFGDYKYKSNYRHDSNYRRPSDYQTWKKSGGRTYYSGKESGDERYKKESRGEKYREESKSKSRGESQEKSRGESRGESKGETQRER